MTNWGIIGLGYIANTFANDLKLVPNANLHAVASRNIETAIAFRDKHNADISYGSYLKLANDPEVNIVYIATPHALHFENAKMCLERGKAVLCEKPMGMSASQVKELCEIAKENNTLLMEAMWTAFHPNFNKLKDLIAQNKLGAIKKVKSDFCFAVPYNPDHRLFNKSLGGGTILDIGIYNVFACLELLGEPNDFKAEAEITETGVDASCNVSFFYDNFEAELLSSFKRDTPANFFIEFQNGSTNLGPNFFCPADLKIETPDSTEILNKYPEGVGYQFEAIHFQDLYLKNQLESPVLPHQKSILLATYLDKILEHIGVSYN